MFVMKIDVIAVCIEIMHFKESVYFPLCALNTMLKVKLRPLTFKYFQVEEYAPYLEILRRFEIDIH